MPIFALLENGSLNWPDIVVATVAVLTLVITMVGGIFKVLAKLDVLIQRIDAYEKKHETFEKKLDDQEVRIRFLELEHAKALERAHT